MVAKGAWLIIGHLCFNSAVEGYKLSNHIYEDNIHHGSIAHGFKTVPNDDQIIFKV